MTDAQEAFVRDSVEVPRRVNEHMRAYLTLKAKAVEAQAAGKRGYDVEADDPVSVGGFIDYLIDEDRS